MGECQIAHNTLYTEKFTLHYTLYTSHFTLHTIHCTLHTINYKLYTIGSSQHIHTAYYTMHNIHDEGPKIEEGIPASLEAKSVYYSLGFWQMLTFADIGGRGVLANAVIG